MNKIINFTLLTLIFNFTLLTFNLGHAQAQEVRTFTIVPPTVVQTLDPGSRAEGVMKLINDSSETLTFSVSVNDFVVEDTKGTPNLLPSNALSKKFSAASWIGVTPDTFTIEPHQKQTLNYYLQIPQDAKPGGHYAAAVYKPVALAGLQGTGASVQTQLGTLFYVSVNGPVSESALVSKFFANKFMEYGPVKILLQIKNLGDLHIRPTGYISISDLFGRTIKTEKIFESNIFPTAARDYENAFGQKIMVGRFKASLLASYGKENNLPLIATVYFWVFPWKLILIVILVIVALFLGLKLWKKSRASINTETTKPE